MPPPATFNQVWAAAEATDVSSQHIEVEYAVTKTPAKYLPVVSVTFREYMFESVSVQRLKKTGTLYATPRQNRTIKEFQRLRSEIEKLSKTVRNEVGWRLTAIIFLIVIIYFAVRLFHWESLTR